MQRLRLVAAAVVLALLVAFVVENSQDVKVHFIFFHATLPLIWALLIAAALGALADRLLPRLRARQPRQPSKGQAGGPGESSHDRQ